jgi:hypothetical protein
VKSEGRAIEAIRKMPIDANRLDVADAQNAEVIKHRVNGVRLRIGRVGWDIRCVGSLAREARRKGWLYILYT